MIVVIFGFGPNQVLFDLRTRPEPGVQLSR